MHVLRIDTFLIPRVVLLDAVTVAGIIQEQSEIGIQIKERPAEKSIGFETVAGRKRTTIKQTGRTESYLAPVARIDVSEPRQPTTCNEIERNLTAWQES